MRKIFALSLMTAALMVSLSIFGGNLVNGTDSVSAANQTTVQWGPFTLPPAGGGEPGQLENVIAKEGGCNFFIDLFATCLDVEVEKPCGNCYITSIQPNLVDATTGEIVNHSTGGMLHHVVTLNWDAPDHTCAPSLFGGAVNLLGLFSGGNERFFAAGNERTVMTMPPGYGYHVKSSDDWGLIMHLMNMTSQERDVVFEFTFTWQQSATSVEPIWFDIDQCDDSELPIPAGYSDTHWDWNSSLNGRIVAIGGHVHDRGISISLENVNTGEIICDSIAGYPPAPNQAPVGPGAGTSGHPASHDIVTSDPLGIETYRMANGVGRISDMTVCQPFSFVRGPRWWGLIPGHKLRLHTQYNRDVADPNDMGIMIAYLDPQ